MCLELLRGLCGAIEATPDLSAFIEYARREVGEIVRHETTWNDVKFELESYGIVCMLGVSAPDKRVFFTDEATMVRMLPFLTFAANHYVAELDIDCDDYSMWAAAFARLLFRVNGVLQCWGDMPLGYHAFNLVYLSGGYKLWEPNAGYLYAGELFESGENSYLPRKWK